MKGVAGGSKENEFTFPRNQRFKVLSDESKIEPYALVIRHIHLKALRPDEETNLEHFSMSLLYLTKYLYSTAFT